VPALELRDVRVLDPEQRVALTLPRVFAALSARSFLAFEPRFEQLLIDGASLDVRRDKSGRIRIAGLDFGNAQGGDDDMAADWFFKQHEFVIRAERCAGSTRRATSRRSRSPTSSSSSATACASTTCASTPPRPPAGASASTCAAASSSRCSRAAATGGAGAGAATSTCRAPT
jgi:hypothetical protein